MATYSDTNGNEWDTAQEALDEFLSELPYMTEEEEESVFQFTHFEYAPERNLEAIAHGVTYSGLDYRFSGDSYPVPTATKD